VLQEGLLDLGVDALSLSNVEFRWVPQLVFKTHYGNGFRKGYE